MVISVFLREFCVPLTCAVCAIQLSPNTDNCVVLVVTTYQLLLPAITTNYVHKGMQNALLCILLFVLNSPI